MPKMLIIIIQYIFLILKKCFILDYIDLVSLIKPNILKLKLYQLWYTIDAGYF